MQAKLTIDFGDQTFINVCGEESPIGKLENIMGGYENEPFSIRPGTGVNMEPNMVAVQPNGDYALAGCFSGQSRLVNTTTTKKGVKTTTTRYDITTYPGAFHMAGVVTFPGACSGQTSVAGDSSATYNAPPGFVFERTGQYYVHAFTGPPDEQLDYHYPTSNTSSTWEDISVHVNPTEFPPQTDTATNVTQVR